MASRSAVAPAVGALAFVSLAGMAWAPQSHAQSKPPVFNATEWGKITAAAKNEKRVIVCSTAVPAIHDRVKEDFEKANPGFATEIHRLVGAEVVSRVERERVSNSDGCDIAIAADVLWIDDNKQHFRAPVGPALKEWPAKYLRANVAPIISLEAFAIAYNTNMVKAPITGYRDLVKPENKLKLGLMNVVAPSLAALYDWLEKNSGPDFWKNFAATKPNFYGGHAAATQAVASGEIHATIATNPNSIIPLIQQGAPIKMVLPNPALAYIYVGAVLANSKRPNASQVMMDYMMSRRGQTTWNSFAQTASPLKGIQGAQDPSQVTAWDPEKWPADAMKAYSDRWTAVVKGQ